MTRYYVFPRDLKEQSVCPDGPDCEEVAVYRAEEVERLAEVERERDNAVWLAANAAEERDTIRTIFDSVKSERDTLRRENQELKARLDEAERELAELRDWRADVTIALQLEQGALFVDVPRHIRDLVRGRAEWKREAKFFEAAAATANRMRVDLERELATVRADREKACTILWSKCDESEPVYSWIIERFPSLGKGNI